MRYTSLKYNKDTKTKYISDKSNAGLIERLGELEDILQRHDLLENNKELERLILLGEAGYARIKLAMGHRVYFVGGNKVKKAHLIGYADNGLCLTDLLIEKKEQTAIIPYNHIFISRREARRARKARQLYKLTDKLYQLIFGNRPYKKNVYLLETVRGTDRFVIVSKSFKTYFKTAYAGNYSIEELKDKFNLDITKEFEKERAEYKEKAKYLKSKWIY